MQYGYLVPLRSRLCLLVGHNLSYLMPTFQSAFLKITRAGSQADYLYEEVKRIFLNPNDPAHRIDFVRGSDPRKWRGIFRLLKQPPDDWPILLGEIIHDLRSALDHLVFEASAFNNGGTPIDRTEFAIYNDPKLFKQQGLKKIRGLNPATHAFVEQVQPFANKDPNIIPYLWLLHQLSNTDKHRLLNLVSVPHGVQEFNVMYSPSETPLTSRHVVNQATVSEEVWLKDGAEYCSFATPDPLPADVHVNMNATVEFDVRLGGATPVANELGLFELLRGMGRMVGAIRNEFIKFNPDPT